MKYIILFVCFSFSLRAQEITFVNQIPVGKAKTTERKIYPPTLWSQCDYFDGYDSYCIFKSSVNKNLYLLGFDSEGEQRMKLKIDEANYNNHFNAVTVIYNGWEVRLYGKLD